MEEILREGRRGHVATLTFNRPESLNALNTDLMHRLVETVRQIGADDTVHCVILTGSGKAFCAGGDTKAIAKASKDRVKSENAPKSTTRSRIRWLRRSAEAARLLHEMPKPTIAMINGACAGAGMSLAAACDLRYASDRAVFRPAFLANGMPGDYGGSWLWTQILGTAKARQLYLVDEKRDATAALDFGLVHDVLPSEQLPGFVTDLADRLASLPPSGFAYAKENLNAAVGETFSEHLQRESQNMVLARNDLVELSKARAKAAATKAESL